MNEIVNDHDVNDDDDYNIIKQLNNYFETIDETKSFKEQIEILKTRNFLNEYWHFGYHWIKNWIIESLNQKRHTF